MSLSLLEIHQLRNLKHVKVSPGPQFNLFYGDNGSGKTSVLEAIHYIALNRSFRSRFSSRLVNYDGDSLTLFAQIQQDPHVLAVGIERHSNGEGRIRINQENSKSIIEVTQALPFRLIHTESRLLLTGPSKLRRQFIDWGVFHVEHGYFRYWQHAQRALKQRNAALRTRSPKTIVKLWDTELASATEFVHPMRKAYLEKFQLTFSQMIAELLPTLEISLGYKQGWNEELGLLQVLEQSYARDLELGYTQYGPQRAELAIRLNKTIPAADGLSQGQQKLLIYALHLAQGLVLRAETNKPCIYLLDDLPAELDEENRHRVVMLLMKMGAQVFITGVEKGGFSSLSDCPRAKMFHVEQGQIFEDEI